MVRDVTHGRRRQTAPHVLIVDDDPHVLAVLVRMLRPPDWATSSAATVADALRLLEGAPFDVLVTDHDLGDPGRSGRWLLGEVRRRWPATRRVLMSGARQVIDDADGIVFLPKPFRAGDVARALRDAT